MSEKQTQDNLSTLLAISLTVVAGIILFFVSKWFLSFVINHWAWILAVVVALIVFGFRSLTGGQK
jgi:hypothetical protein